MGLGQLTTPPKEVERALRQLTPRGVTCNVYQQVVRSTDNAAITTFYRLQFLSPTPPFRVLFTESDLADDGKESTENGRDADEQAWRWLLAKAENHFAKLAALERGEPPQLVNVPTDFPAKTPATRAREKAARLGKEL